MPVKQVNKKYLKIGIAGLAVVALVVGLSVGLSSKNRNKNVSASAANASGQDYGTYKDEDLPECSIYTSWSSHSSSGKSGKSGGGKSGKSGGSSSSSSSSEDDARRVLVVPSVYNVSPAKANGGKRRKLRSELLRGEYWILLLIRTHENFIQSVILFFNR